MSPTKLRDCNVKNKTKVGLGAYFRGGGWVREPNYILKLSFLYITPKPQCRVKLGKLHHSVCSTNDLLISG